jgi:hypothetical protein
MYKQVTPVTNMADKACDEPKSLGGASCSV